MTARGNFKDNPKNISTEPCPVTRTAANRVTLSGGLGDGHEMIVGFHQRWLCYVVPSAEPPTIPGAASLKWEQYSPDANGVWRPIDQYHPLYLA